MSRNSRKSSTSPEANGGADKLNRIKNLHRPLKIVEGRVSKPGRPPRDGPSATARMREYEDVLITVNPQPAGPEDKLKESLEYYESNPHRVPQQNTYTLRQGTHSHPSPNTRKSPTRGRPKAPGPQLCFVMEDGRSDSGQVSPTSTDLHTLRNEETNGKSPSRSSSSLRGGRSRSTGASKNSKAKNERSLSIPSLNLSTSQQYNNGVYSGNWVVPHTDDAFSSSSESPVGSGVGSPLQTLSPLSLPSLPSGPVTLPLVAAPGLDHVQTGNFYSRSFAASTMAPPQISHSAPADYGVSFPSDTLPPGPSAWASSQSQYHAHGQLPYLRNQHQSPHQQTQGYHYTEPAWPSQIHTTSGYTQGYGSSSGGPSYHGHL